MSISTPLTLNINITLNVPNAQGDSSQLVTASTSLAGPRQTLAAPSESLPQPSSSHVHENHTRRPQPSGQGAPNQYGLGHTSSQEVERDFEQGAYQLRRNVDTSSSSPAAVPSLRHTELDVFEEIPATQHDNNESYEQPERSLAVPVASSSAVTLESSTLQPPYPQENVSRDVDYEQEPVDQPFYADETSYFPTTGEVNFPATTVPSPSQSPAPPSNVLEIRRPRRHSCPEQGVPVRYECDVTFLDKSTGEAKQNADLTFNPDSEDVLEAIPPLRAQTPVSDGEEEWFELETVPSTGHENDALQGSGSSHAVMVSANPVLPAQEPAEQPTHASIPQDLSYQYPDDQTQFIYHPSNSYPNVFPQYLTKQSYTQHAMDPQNELEEGLQNICYQQQPSEAPYGGYGRPPGLVTPPRFRRLRALDDGGEFALSHQDQGVASPVHEALPSDHDPIPGQDFVDEQPVLEQEFIPTPLEIIVGDLVPTTKLPLTMEDVVNIPAFDDKQPLSILPSTLALSPPLDPPARCDTQDREERKAAKKEEKKRKSELKIRKAIEAALERPLREQQEEAERLRNWELHLQKEEIRQWNEELRLKEDEERLRAKEAELLKKEEEEHHPRGVDMQQPPSVEERRTGDLQADEERLRQEEARLRMVADDLCRIKAEEREAQRQQKSNMRAEEERLRKEEERMKKERERLTFEGDRLRHEEERLNTEKEALRNERDLLKKTLEERVRKEEEEKSRKKAEKREAQRLRDEEERKRKEAEKVEAKRFAEKVKEHAERLDRERRETDPLYRVVSLLSEPRRLCERDEGKPCKGCTAMNSLENLLKQLPQRYNGLVGVVAKCHNTHISRVSNTILISIFERCTSEYKDVQSRNAVIVPIRLAAVCKEWRQLTLSFPQLWNTLVFDLRPSEAKHLETIRDYLLRSRDLPLRIRLQGQPDISDEDAKQVFPILDLLNSVSERWGELDLCLPSSLLSRVEGNSMSLSALKALQIQSPNTSSEEDFEGQLTFNADKPCPETVTIQNVRFAAVGVKWDCLVKAQISGLGLDECLELLKQAHNLASIMLSDVAAPSGHFSLPNKPIIHGHTTCVEFDGCCDNKALDLFFANLTLMALKDLKIGSSLGHPIPCKTLIPFLRRSGCALTTLSLSPCSASDDDILPVLRETSSLVSLQIKPSRLSPIHNPRDLFKLLGETALPSIGSEEPFLPKLQRLEFFPYADAFKWDSLRLVFGPIRGMRNPSGMTDPRRRQLNSIRICFLHDLHAPPIPKEDAISLLGLRFAGVSFEFHDMSGSTDLLGQFQAEAKSLGDVLSLGRSMGEYSEDFLLENLPALSLFYPDITQDSNSRTFSFIIPKEVLTTFA